MKRNASLLVIGKDFPILLRSYSGARKQRTVRKLLLRSEVVTLDPEAIRKKVKVLQEKYPDKEFYFEWTEVTNKSCPDPTPLSFQMERHMTRGMTCWIIGRREKGGKNIPLYWSPRFHRLYVPKSYYQHQKRLTCSVISYRLRDLGIPYNLGYA